MAVLENGFPFDNVEYDATALGAWLSTRTRGVFSDDEHYAVTAIGGMQVSVSSGIAWLKMNEQWGMVAPNPAAITLSVDVGDTILNRIDVACLRIDKNQSVQEVVIKKGELAATPAYPALVRDLNYDEVFLAAINVPAGTTELNAALITDLRGNETYCGIMRDGVTGIPTAQLQAQAEALIESLEDAIAGVIDGSQYMLKTEYAPDATAEISGSTLVITSNTARLSTDYDLRFQVPDGYESGMPLTVDGDAVTVKDSSNEETELDAAPGAIVYLMRNGASVFPKTGGAASASIQVIGSTTNPANPKNGMIWAYTATAVGKVYYGNEAEISDTLMQDGDIFIISGRSNIAVKNRNGTVAFSPVAVVQKQAGNMVSLAAQVWQGAQWKMFYPTDGLVNYCTGADYVNQVDGVAGNVTGVSIVTDATAGPVLATTYANTTTLNWPSAIYAAGLRRGTMIGAFKTTYNHTNQAYVCSCGSDSTGSSMGIGLSKNEYAQCYGATNAAILSTPMNDGNWHVVSGVFDYDTQTSEKVIVRDESGNKATNTGNTLTTGNSFSIGNRASSPANVHVVVGNIAQVFFYQRVLSEYEVQALTKTISNKVKGVF